jgi:hypothetical protein
MVSRNLFDRQAGDQFCSIFVDRSSLPMRCMMVRRLYQFQKIRLCELIFEMLEKSKDSQPPSRWKPMSYSDLRRS